MCPFRYDGRGLRTHRVVSCPAATCVKIETVKRIGLTQGLPLGWAESRGPPATPWERFFEPLGSVDAQAVAEGSIVPEDAGPVEEPVTEPGMDSERPVLPENWREGETAPGTPRDDGPATSWPSAVGRSGAEAIPPAVLFADPPTRHLNVNNPRCKKVENSRKLHSHIPRPR